ncbi:hypothetical protein ACF1BP_35730 [Streptomyces sp. NPDC014735]|uniref:hypothetical protein n=1 Tax=unclassified Streptomyces TaxID=2593676 RepID=UPI003700694A
MTAGRSQQAALTAIADATGAREGEAADVLDLTDERQRESFITLVQHTISAEIWGPAGSGVSFSASDTGAAIGCSAEAVAELTMDALTNDQLEVLRRGGP